MGILSVVVGSLGSVLITGWEGVEGVEGGAVFAVGGVVLCFLLFCAGVVVAGMGGDVGCGGSDLIGVE